MGVSLTSRLPQLERKLVAKAELAVAKAAKDVESHAKNRVPVDTGNLMSSIESRETGALKAEVSADAEYAIYVEYGSHHNSRLQAGATKTLDPAGMFSTQHVWNIGEYSINAQPYMVPAAEAVRPQFITAMNRLV